jgi:hypothetical protein
MKKEATTTEGSKMLTDWDLIVACLYWRGFVG